MGWKPVGALSVFGSLGARSVNGLATLTQPQVSGSSEWLLTPVFQVLPPPRVPAQAGCVSET